jgi:biotin carboxyl carrier protein
MKKFAIKVNGVNYEVEVEELGGGFEKSAIATPVPKVAPVPASTPASPPVTAAPASAPVTAAAPGKSSAPVPQGSEVITAPMPGKITSLKVKKGQAVKAGDLVLTLEAMKMENEIFCGSSGIVEEIRVNEGSTVNPGDVMLVIA